MNNLLKLTKINLLTFFSFYKIKNSKNFKELKKSITMLILILGGIGVFAYYLYDIANNMMKGFVALNIPYLLPVVFFVFTSTLILFTNIYKINGTLYSFKDYDLLMSLPIKTTTIISSKLITLYFSNMFYVLILMVPAFIVYLKSVTVNFAFCLLYIFTMFIIPLIPIIISTIIGSIFTGISSKFRFKNIFNTIFMLLFFIGTMYLSFSIQKTTTIDMVNFGKSLIKVFNNIYPLTKYYVDIIKNNNLISLLVFIIVPIALFIIFDVIINKFYQKINNNLHKITTSSNYKLKKAKTTSPLISLYKKELKRYLSSFNYILNTAIGAILLTIAVIGLVIFGGEKIDAFLGLEGMSEMIIKFTPIVLASFCALNCSTHSSISLEGKNLWIIKSLPVNPMIIFFSKIMVNLTILIPTIIINSIILAFYLKTSFLTFILMLLTPLMYSIFISIIGLILDLNFPIFDWKSEIKVIKQSLSSFLTVLIGILLAIIPLNIETNLNSALFTFIVTIIVLMLNIIGYIYLNTIGTKKFSKL